MAASVRTFKLAAEHELRLDIGHKQKAKMKLVEGLAEVFGTEMLLGLEYELEATKTDYLRIHHKLEEMRTIAHNRMVAEQQQQLPKDTESKFGPRIMILGPTDVGKSSVSKILLNYAIRLGRRPIYVDLDIGQGSISIPGVTSATTLSRPVGIEGGFDDVSPLVFFFGHVSPEKNQALFKLHIEKLAEAVDRRLAFKKSNGDLVEGESGIIVNTCGWIVGAGLELLKHHIAALKIDIAVVLENDRLVCDLKQFEKDSGVKFEVIALRKSTGVVERDRAHRIASRTLRVREYFYGVNDTLSPGTIWLSFDNVVIYRIGSEAAPSSALTLGATPQLTPTSPVQEEPKIELQHSVFAVVVVKEESEIPTANAAGFVYVAEVNMKTRALRLVAPSSHRLPQSGVGVGKKVVLVAGSLKWVEQ